jgi:hypothetical protein
MINSLTKSDCSIYQIGLFDFNSYNSAASFIKFHNRLFTPPLTDIKELSNIQTIKSRIRIIRADEQRDPKQQSKRKRNGVREGSHGIFFSDNQLPHPQHIHSIIIVPDEMSPFCKRRLCHSSPNHHYMTLSSSASTFFMA